jgi:hypothetical protein
MMMPVERDNICAYRIYANPLPEIAVVSLSLMQPHWRQAIPIASGTTKFLKELPSGERLAGLGVWLATAPHRQCSTRHTSQEKYEKSTQVFD